jgi:peptide deformylase
MNDDNFAQHKLVYVPHPALDTPSAPFEFDDVEYRKALGKHMIELMHNHRGVGLAANQINLNAACFAMLLGADDVFMINPQVHEVSNTKVLMSEGCLSDPGMFLKVKRPDAIRASWENEEGERHHLELEGLDARVFLHEFDHLQGILFTDRVGGTKLKMARKKQQGELIRHLGALSRTH